MLKSSLAEVLLDLALAGAEPGLEQEVVDPATTTSTPGADVENALYDYRRWLTCFGHVNSDQEQSFYLQTE